MTAKECRCDSFTNPSTKPCRFAKHPEPALCGREERKPDAPTWGFVPEWYGALAGDGDSGDEA